MRKIVLLIMAIIFMAGISSAQENKNDFRKKLMIGLKAGANYSNVYDTKGKEFSADPKFGFVGGVFLSIPIGKFLGVQPEVLYSQKGFKAKGSYLDYPYELTRTLTFIDIPLLITLKPASFLSIVAGPQFSYLIKQKDVFTSNLLSDEQEQDFKNDNIRKNIFCLIGGVDVNLSHIVLGVRVGWDVSNNNGDGSSTNPQYRNVWYQATLGLRF
jgi:hypothetical protein